ncbi:Transglycosylase SLT domain-containing protein [Sphingopyxis sp. YR583]|uniref:lytic transglycosylase domain-containing protein n=1 Tax=Sphingopyxis sp. YR583 TaxID=1881047 RepID=UPI0008A7C55A|nr:lytic transglycosylase domain-containing protein [Sphingopyxis sp. YR583]SEH12681.1 Transglycosylase SLT domain-containing protein [Sphingopyxis sp. YR583]
MAPLRWALLPVLLLAAGTPARADPVTRWRAHVEEASARFGVPAEWIETVMRAESGGRTTLAGAPIVSRAGAMGLMQLMPATWTDMRGRLGLGDDPHAPRDNILAGTLYLRLMYERFGYPGLFAAYNAGPARYAAVLAGRARLPAETRAYLADVAGRDGSSRPMRPVRDASPLAGAREASGAIFFLCSEPE